MSEEKKVVHMDIVETRPAKNDGEFKGIDYEPQTMQGVQNVLQGFVRPNNQGPSISGGTSNTGTGNAPTNGNGSSTSNDSNP